MHLPDFNIMTNLMHSFITRYKLTAMLNDSLPTEHQFDTITQFSQPKVTIYQEQELIYNYLMRIVKEWSPSEVLAEFKRLFIEAIDTKNNEVLAAIYNIIFINNEEEFRNTLKRSCYILVNTWEVNRQQASIQKLVQLFKIVDIDLPTFSPTLGRLRFWLNNFIKSKDFQELKLFAYRSEEQETETQKSDWSNRYNSYLLTTQYLDFRNSFEQREAARRLAKKLKDQFKFDLAMYTTFSESQFANQNGKIKNPTAISDGILRLIKKIVIKKGIFSYENLANIFLSQTEGILYVDFKKSLQKYLIFSVEKPDFVQTLEKNLATKLESLYADYHEETLNKALLLRTCNRVIEYLTTEERGKPTLLFLLLLNKGNPLNLVIVLLKIVLISKNSRSHLEACIAKLVQYYQDYPQDDCQWVINFFEIFNITFAIHGENVQFNLIKIKNENGQNPADINYDSYRIFAQTKLESELAAFDEENTEEETELQIDEVISDIADNGNTILQ